MKRKLKPYSSYYNANILEVIQQKSIDPDDFSMAEASGTDFLQCYQLRSSWGGAESPKLSEGGWSAANGIS